MIANERQYRVSKAQLRHFREALSELLGNVRTLDPALIEIQRRALESQCDELEASVKEYDELKSGETIHFVSESFSQLPLTLIKARIAHGLTQSQLASRLQVKEQQVQRWEATEYSGTSLETIRRVMKALEVETVDEVYLPNPRLSLKGFMRSLENVGVSSHMLLTRILPPDLAQAFEAGLESHNLLFRAASLLSRVFSIPTRDWLSSTAPSLCKVASAAGRFKRPVRANRPLLDAYTVYAHYLAALSARCATFREGSALPGTPREMRALLDITTPELSLRGAINALWDCGVVVLPLQDAGAFHGAVWKISERFVVVLKQATELESRWLFDMLHETAHIALKHVTLDSSWIEEADISPAPADSPEESAASEWAEDVLFCGQSDQIEAACTQACRGRLEALKEVIPRVAASFNVPVGSLANHMAYRLASQGQKWWGPAHNLQRSGEQPFTVARDIFLSRVDLRSLSDPDSGLLLRALDK